MPIIVKQSVSGSNFAPPPAGAYPAVCVDIVDMGLLKVTFGGKEKTQHKVRIVWQLNEAQPGGKPYELGRKYTMSLHEKASLRRDLESWRGKPFDDQELAGFDLEVLLGKACLLNVIHSKPADGGIPFANIAGIMRLPKGMEAPVQRDYVRVCDREPGDDAQPNEHGYMPTDDDVPAW